MSENPSIKKQMRKIGFDSFQGNQIVCLFNLVRGSSSADRASPCQGEGRGFDPRLPLHSSLKL